MRIEFSRLSGIFISQRPASVDGKSAAELLGEAREALAGCYEGDEYSIWPRREYAANAPEQVQIIDGGGAILVEYSLGDLLAECGRCLAPKDAKRQREATD